MQNTKNLLDSYQYLATHYQEQYQLATINKVKQEYKRQLTKIQKDISILMQHS